MRKLDHLRVLIANERPERLADVAALLDALGHEVIARETLVADVGPSTFRERPDVAMVGLGTSSAHALEMIGKAVHEASCPVIALLPAHDSAFVSEAAKRGIFGYVTDADSPDKWRNALEIVLLRFAEYSELEEAFGRRAVIERAKGIVMERHSLDDKAAFDLLRGHARSLNRKLIDVAHGVLDGHALLPQRGDA